MKRWIIPVVVLLLVGGVAAGAWWVKANRLRRGLAIQSMTKDIAARLGLAI